MSDEEADVLDPKEELLKNQRKEKKDLQAKIQALKKTASKGDKKKKKEVNDEIAKLEADLEQKHKTELLTLETKEISLNGASEDASNNEDTKNCDNDTANNDVEAEIKGPRISKAQKRRDKKAEKEKQHLLDIERQEQENLTGKRNVEQETISRLLEGRGLSLFEVPSDGDCMFAGLVHQLSLQGETKSVSELRQDTAQEMRDNSDHYLPFLSLTPNQFQVYCNKMATTPEWGGQVELLALANILSKPIEVIQAEGSPMIIGEHFTAPKLILTYHRHAYGLGEHYNSVLPQ